MIQCIIIVKIKRKNLDLSLYLGQQSERLIILQWISHIFLLKHSGEVFLLLKKTRKIRKFLKKKEKD